MLDVVSGLVIASAVSHGGELGLNEEGSEGQLGDGVKAVVERGRLGRVVRYTSRHHF